MAGIDKTYVSTYHDWKMITDWMKAHEFKCPNGMVLKGSHYLIYRDGSKEEIKDWIKEQKSIPVMNTNCSMDYFLIKHCPISIVQERMEEVYGSEYCRLVKEGKSEYDKFVRPQHGKHVSFIAKPLQYYTYKVRNYKGRKMRPDYSVFVSYPQYLNPHCCADYNEDYDQFLLPNELGYFTCSGSVPTKCKTVRSLIKKIIRWKFPIGTTITVHGRYANEGFQLRITK